MAINTVTIQVRRGNWEDFDMTKMKPGELAIVLANDPNVKTGKSIYFTTAAGMCKRLMTQEDLMDEIYNATSEITTELRQDINEAIKIINDNESARQEAERLRKVAEENRKKKFSAKLAEVDASTSAAISKTDAATERANQAAADATAATGNANAVAQQLIQDRDAGLFKGDKGDKGDKGESGVTAPTNGFFTLSVDDDGDLWAHYADNPPPVELDEDGNLYYVVPD